MFVVTGAWIVLQLESPHQVVLPSEMQIKVVKWGFWESYAGLWLLSVVLPLPSWTVDKMLDGVQAPWEREHEGPKLRVRTGKMEGPGLLRT